MRVNMDSSIASDPRFKLLGKALGISWREAIGSCYLLWLACYERRSERFSEVEADASAEIDGFAKQLVAVGLAHYDGAHVVIHGVCERIQFLRKQRIRGRTGGRKSGASRRRADSSGDVQNEANASRAHEANASRTAQAYTPAPAPALSPAPAQSQKTEDPPTPRPTFPPELDTERFRNLWEGWLRHRREIRHPLKPTQADAQLAKLAREGEATASERILRSIENGWRGLWFREDGPDRPARGGRPDPAAAILRQVGEAKARAEGSANG